ncbi:hypothetical protein DAPPUDRAFT_336066 [Daphnia pulex]|uniref:Uncharacterized protein n=1 Tax=Daphnia pulex TaxID=6669 RepID=E9HZ20_DAPPU|nr:hypothetical protein DAPPUDRAFT_336066 [Daphnia pulex]|eukprot:EFX63010.1 hypothetical protein DAPPUDRAFT_336066 [Daphnia pulex]
MDVFGLKIIMGLTPMGVESWKYLSGGTRNLSRKHRTAIQSIQFSHPIQVLDPIVKTARKSHLALL